MGQEMSNPGKTSLERVYGIDLVGDTGRLYQKLLAIERNFPIPNPHSAFIFLIEILLVKEVSSRAAMYISQGKSAQIKSLKTEYNESRTETHHPSTSQTVPMFHMMASLVMMLFNMMKNIMIDITQLQKLSSHRNDLISRIKTEVTQLNELLTDLRIQAQSYSPSNFPEDRFYKKFPEFIKKFSTIPTYLNKANVQYAILKEESYETKQIMKNDFYEEILPVPDMNKYSPHSPGMKSNYDVCIEVLSSNPNTTSLRKQFESLYLAYTVCFDTVNYPSYVLLQYDNMVNNYYDAVENGTVSCDTINPKKVLIQTLVSVLLLHSPKIFKSHVPIFTGKETLSQNDKVCPLIAKQQPIFTLHYLLEIGRNNPLELIPDLNDIKLMVPGLSPGTSVTATLVEVAMLYCDRPLLAVLLSMGLKCKLDDYHQLICLDDITKAFKLDWQDDPEYNKINSFCNQNFIFPLLNSNIIRTYHPTPTLDHRIEVSSYILDYLIDDAIDMDMAKNIIKRLILNNQPLHLNHFLYRFELQIQTGRLDLHAIKIFKYAITLCFEHMRFQCLPILHLLACDFLNHSLASVIFSNSFSVACSMNMNIPFDEDKPTKLWDDLANVVNSTPLHLGNLMSLNNPPPIIQEITVESIGTPILPIAESSSESSTNATKIIDINHPHDASNHLVGDDRYFPKGLQYTAYWLRLLFQDLISSDEIELFVLFSRICKPILPLLITHVPFLDFVNCDAALCYAFRRSASSCATYLFDQFKYFTSESKNQSEEVNIDQNSLNILHALSLQAQPPFCRLHNAVDCPYCPSSLTQIQDEKITPDKFFKLLPTDYVSKVMAISHTHVYGNPVNFGIRHGNPQLLKHSHLNLNYDTLLDDFIALCQLVNETKTLFVGNDKFLKRLESMSVLGPPENQTTIKDDNNNQEVEQSKNKNKKSSTKQTTTNNAKKTPIKLHVTQNPIDIALAHDFKGPLTTFVAPGTDGITNVIRRPRGDSLEIDKWFDRTYLLCIQYPGRRDYINFNYYDGLLEGDDLDTYHKRFDTLDNDHKLPQIAFINRGWAELLTGNKFFSIIRSRSDFQQICTIIAAHARQSMITQQFYQRSKLLNSPQAPYNSRIYFRHSSGFLIPRGISALIDHCSIESPLATEHPIRVMIQEMIYEGYRANGWLKQLSRAR